MITGHFQRVIVRKPHIKRVALRGVWVWGAFMSRTSVSPFALSQVLAHIAKAAARRV